MTANGVIGLKLMWFQLIMLGREGRRYLARPCTALEILSLIVGPIRIVRLERRDKLLQAISWVRARQTGVWSLRQGTSTEAGLPAMYDSRAIADAARSILSQSHHWDAAISLLEPPLLRMWYEDVAENFEAATVRVMDFLGLHGVGRLPSRPTLQKQSDDLTEEWARRAKVDLDTCLLAQLGHSDGERTADRIGPARRPPEGSVDRINIL